MPHAPAPMEPLSMPMSSSAVGWPTDVDLDAWYAAERAEADETIRDALDLSVWSLEAKKEHTSVYVHCKNNEKLSYSVRAVTRVTGHVASVLECLRAPDNATLRAFTKLLHAKVFLDSEVLHHHQGAAAPHESLALKWLAFATGKKTLGKGKEFCFREYCALVPDHPQYGTVGVVKLESYDGVGARYGIRAKQDTYSLTVLEPSSIVVCPSGNDDGLLTVTMTLAMRKARGANSVSSGVKALSMRLAQDLAHLQRAVQHVLFQPSALADKKEWVRDRERTNCSLCVQTFSMLKRRHHCRVCGEVVCSNCTVFKVVAGAGDQQDGGNGSGSGSNGGASGGTHKVRVCKACLNKSSTSEPVPRPHNNQLHHLASMQPPPPASSSASSSAAAMAPPYAHQAPASMPNFKNITLSTVSTSSGASTSSDESRRSGDESDSIPSRPPAAMAQYRPQPLPHRPMYSKGSSSSSFGDLESSNPAYGGSLSPRSTTQTNVSMSSTGSAGSDGGGSTTSSSSLLPSRSLKLDKRTHYFNDDFEEICMLAMETLQCAMAGIRTDDFELVNYFTGQQLPDLPRSLPTFRRIASRGKPCIVLDVSADKRIAGDKRSHAKLQFFVGIPLIMDGEVIGDLCVADRHPRESIDYKAVEVLMVLGKTVTQYMTSRDYLEDLADFKASQRQRREQQQQQQQQQHHHASSSSSSALPLGHDGGGGIAIKEVAF